MSRLTIIVAATKQNGIGQGSRLPWRLPKEMAYFARVTSASPEKTRNAVVMGRKTWDSIPSKLKPLRDRVNVILTTNPEFDAGTSQCSEVIIGSSLENGLEKLAERDSTSIHRIFIIGGTSIYAEAFELGPSSGFSVDRVLLTRVMSPDFADCDVFLPDFLGTEGGASWAQASHEELQAWVGFEVPEGVQTEKGVDYEFQMWTRRE